MTDRTLVPSRLLAAAIAMVGLLALPALARSDEMEVGELLRLSIDQLLAVSSVSKKTEIAGEAPAIVSVYTRADLDRLQPRNLSDLLELTVGFLVERDQDDTVWGGRGVVTDNNQKYMIAIDGHRISNGNNFGVNPFHKTRQLIEMAERIEILRGPGGVLWGPDAFLGLINIITRRPEHGQRHGRASLTYGPTDDTKHASLTYLHAVDAETSVAAFLDVLSSHGEATSTRLAGAGGYDRDPGGFLERFETPTYSLHARLEHGSTWLTGQVVEMSARTEGFPQNDDFRQMYVEVGHRLRLGESHELSARLYVDDYDVARRLTDGSPDPLDMESPERRVGTEVVLSTTWNETISTVFGWDGRYSRYDGGHLAERFMSLSSNGRASATGGLLHNGLFGQLTARLDRLLVNVGGRFDTFDDHIDNLFFPRLTVGYRFTDQLTAKLLYTEGALRPSWAHMSAWFSVGGTDIFEGVIEERSRSFELHAAYAGKDYASALTLYRSRFEDTVNFVNGPLGFGFYNYADYTAVGLEWENKLKLSEHAEAFLNLSYYFDVGRDELVQTTDPDDPGLIGEFSATFVIPGTDQPYNIPDVFLAAGATVGYGLGGGRLEVSPIIRFKGARTVQGIRGESSDRELDSFYVDLKSRYTFSDRFDLSLAGFNVFDNDDPVGIGNGVAGLVIPKGATWEASLTWRF